MAFFPHFGFSNAQQVSDPFISKTFAFKYRQTRLIQAGKTSGLNGSFFFD